MIWTFPENGKVQIIKTVTKWYSKGREKRKDTPKSTWNFEIRGIIGKMKLAEEDWRYRESWRQKMTL